MQAPESKPLAERRLWEFQAVRDALVLIVLFGVVWLGKVLSLVTVPILMGLGLAYLIEPLVGWLTTHFRWMTRRRAVITIAFSVVVAVSGLLACIVPPIVAQGIELAGNSERYATQAHSWLTHPDRPAWLRERSVTLDELLRKTGMVSAPKLSLSGVPPVKESSPAAAVPLDEARIRQLIRETMAQSQSPVAPTASLGERLLEVIKTVGAGLASIAGGLFTVILTIAIALVTAASFSLVWPDVLSAGRELIPPRQRERILGLIDRMDHTVSAFVRGRLTVAAIVGCLYAIGWTIVGVPYGLLLGFMVGVLSLVPYLAAVGLPAAWLLLILHLIAQPESTSWYVTSAADGTASIVWWKVFVFPWLVNFVAQQIEDYVLNPLIQGKATELHPAAIMIAVIAGGSLAGLYGMLLAVPVAACGKILLTAEILPRFKRWVDRSAASV